MASRTRSGSTGRTPPPRTRAKPKRRFPPEVLTDTEVRALINACPATSATGLRNKALLAILYRSGLRISEALDLYPKDVELERGAIRGLLGTGARLASSASIVARWRSWHGGWTFAPVAATGRHARSSVLPRASGSPVATSAAGCPNLVAGPAWPSACTLMACGTPAHPCRGAILRLLASTRPPALPSLRVHRSRLLHRADS